MSAQVVEHNGRFALATWDERAGQWTEQMTPEAKRVTGCLAVFARTEAGIVSSACVQHFRTRRAAELALAIRETPLPEYGSTTPGYEGDA